MLSGGCCVVFLALTFLALAEISGVDDVANGWCNTASDHCRYNLCQRPSQKITTHFEQITAAAHLHHVLRPTKSRPTRPFAPTATPKTNGTICIMNLAS